MIIHKMNHELLNQMSLNQMPFNPNVVAPFMHACVTARGDHRPTKAHIRSRAIMPFKLQQRPFGYHHHHYYHNLVH